MYWLACQHILSELLPEIHLSSTLFLEGPELIGKNFYVFLYGIFFRQSLYYLWIGEQDSSIATLDGVRLHQSRSYGCFDGIRPLLYRETYCTTFRYATTVIQQLTVSKKVITFESFQENESCSIYTSFSFWLNVIRWLRRPHNTTNPYYLIVLVVYSLQKSVTDDFIEFHLFNIVCVYLS